MYVHEHEFVGLDSCKLTCLLQVIGGHKANINNPNTSGQAKQHSQDVLNEIGHDTRSSSGANDTTGKNMGNVRFRWSLGKNLWLTCFFRLLGGTRLR